MVEKKNIIINIYHYVKRIVSIMVMIKILKKYYVNVNLKQNLVYYPN